MERALSRFPLFSFLASDLRRWTLWGVQKWESCGFPVITQHKVSPSTEGRTQRVTHAPRQTCKRGVYLRPPCLHEQMHAHVKKHFDAINPFSGAERERSVSLQLLINKLLDNIHRVFTLLIYRRSNLDFNWCKKLEICRGNWHNVGYIWLFFWPQKQENKMLICSKKQFENALEANVI